MEAVDAIKKARLHRKVTTTIFFESNGGQLHAEATVPEVRLAVAEPDLDIGNIETVLETLGSSCYFLSVERNRYRFSLSPNLNKLLADRRASIQSPKIEERMRSEVQKVFAERKGGEPPIYFPEKSSQIPDRPFLTSVVLAPDQSLQDEKKTVQWVDAMTREHGTSARTFKSALIWCVADTASALREEARKVLAWEAIQDEEDTLRLDDGQKRQLVENLKKAQRDLREAVWRTYKNILLLGKDNSIRTVDLGLVHSSAADTMVTLILNRLRQDGDVEEGVSPNFLIRNWSPAFTEWSTKAVRDAFFASPQFPRLLNGEVVKETIARGVRESRFAYVGKTTSSEYDPFCYGDNLSVNDVELSDDMFLITKETAEQYKKVKEATPPVQQPVTTSEEPTSPSDPIITITSEGGDGATMTIPSPSPVKTPSLGAATGVKWTGEVPPQKWMNFYTKVLSRFAASKGLKITLTVEVSSEGGVSEQKIEETKVALRELGLKDDVQMN